MTEPEQQQRTDVVTEPGAAASIPGLFLGLRVGFCMLQGSYVEEESPADAALSGSTAKLRELAGYPKPSIGGYPLSTTQHVAVPQAFPNDAIPRGATS